MPVFGTLINDTQPPSFTSFGNTVAAIGDINGDGFGDFALGLAGFDASGTTSGGTYYSSPFGGGVAVLFGSASGLPPTVDVEALDPADGFIITGGPLYSATGYDVAGAGDLNGDGIDDVLITTEGRPFGDVFILFGSTAPTLSPQGHVVLDPAASNVTRIEGTQTNSLEDARVFAVDDFNGDGFRDLGLALPDAPVAFGYTTYGFSYSFPGPGEIVLIAGSDSYFALPIDLDALPNGSLVLTNPGQNYYRQEYSPTYFSAQNEAPRNPTFFGASVASGGDFNADGFSDTIVGAPFLDLSYLMSGTRYSPGGTPTYTYSFAQNIGDVGAAYIFFGTDTNPGSRDVTALNGTTGFTFLGADRDDRAGTSVDVIGDFNGDGFDDFIIGAPGATGSQEIPSSYTTVTYPGGYNPVDPGSGTYTLVYSPAFTSYVPAGYTRYGAPAPGQLAYTYTRPAYSTYFPAYGGNFARIQQTITVYTYATVTRADAGQAYVIFGTASPMPAELTAADLNSATGFIIGNGVQEGFVALGRSVAGLGDVNGDGFDDIAVVDDRVILGASRFDADINRVNIIFGSATEPMETVVVDDLDGSAGYRVVLNPGNGLSFNDLEFVDGGDINGDGFSDVILSRTDGYSSYTSNGSVQSYTAYSVAARVFSGGSADRWAYLDAFDGSEDGTIYTSYFGSNTFIGDIYADLKTGTADADTIVGLGGDDTLLGLGGDDSIFGDQGRDSIEGGLGDDELDGGSNFDIVSFENSATGVTANLAAGLAFGEGADTI
ncbi:FG-GAP repeat protein, partial [Cognatishimia sp. F0-27]|nr:FG-GAP repeat protein [Cognatishimia sp. F0-27]